MITKIVFVDSAGETFGEFEYDEGDSFKQVIEFFKTTLNNIERKENAFTVQVLVNKED